MLRAVKTSQRSQILFFRPTNIREGTPYTRLLCLCITDTRVFTLRPPTSIRCILYYYSILRFTSALPSASYITYARIIILLDRYTHRDATQTVPSSDPGLIDWYITYKYTTLCVLLSR